MSAPETLETNDAERRRETRSPIVVIDGAGRSFGQTAVLADLNLVLSEGEVLGVVGPNGGGKSTLLLMMAGLVRPSVGTIKVCGIDAYELALTAAGIVGLVTARPGLYPLLTGRENLRHFGGLYGLTPDQVDERAEPLSRSLGIDSSIEQRVCRLSTGMQQKLSLVRALLLSPKLLLFDEPTANLDPFASMTLHEEIRRRADKGLACVLVTHDLTAAEAICDRVLLVDVRIKRELRFAHRRAPLAGPLVMAWQEAVSSS